MSWTSKPSFNARLKQCNNNKFCPPVLAAPLRIELRDAKTTTITMSDLFSAKILPAPSSLTCPTFSILLLLPFPHRIELRDAKTN